MALFSFFIIFVAIITSYFNMQYHKKIYEKNTLLRWLVIVSIVIVVFFQIFSLVQQYKYLSEMLDTVLEDKFEQAVEMYRTTKLKKLENKFSIEFNPDNEKESASDLQLDYKSEKLSFDKLMYKVTGLAIAEEELDINELDSIFKAVLIDDNMLTDYKIVVYVGKTDTIITQVSDKADIKYLHFTSRKEIDVNRDAQVHFNSPARLIFQKMFLYIVFSGLMLVAVVVALVYQLRIIFKQKKIEQIRKDFTDSMIHELRNPLQGALSMTELVENDSFTQNTKRRKEVIERIKRNLSNLNQMLSSIIERSFSEETQPETNWQEENLVEYINEIIENTTISTNKQIRFNTSFAPETYDFAFDNIHLPNALRNLVENAVKYSENEVMINITSSFDGVFLNITVSDNGLGIRKEDIPYVFTKFYRGKSAQQIYGLGLGLSYVKWVAELHNGQATVESEIGKGSKFTLTIPLNKSEL